MAVNVRDLDQSTYNFPFNSFQVRILTGVDIKALRIIEYDGRSEM